jgi:hypothetical protein
MKPFRLIAPLVLASAALTVIGGAATARAAATCRHTNVVFYTSDTANLAKALATAANGSPCADYYLSVTPTATGLPRSAPLAAVHALGSNFHVMAEIRLKGFWSDYAQANGWYAAGVEARRQMRLAGYDASLGDTWAVNEVGEPSGGQMGVDVIKGNGQARQNLEELLRGLYTGDDGVPSSGLVFAADPFQATADVSQYAQDLRNWYSDVPFWQAMSSYVRFWAQETYADARTWGVSGSTLEERAAYLNDYFLHGSRIAAEGNDATAAARTFFAHAYTPVGNASYRYGQPDPVTGIGFGFTDIGAVGMRSFISAQTYALRSSIGDRFGFAVVPINDAPDRASIEARVGAAIHDSESDPLGACTGAGESCAFDVAGAASTGTWSVFANTLEGSDVAVQVDSGVSVTYSDVFARGATWLSSSVPDTGPSGFEPLAGTRATDIETTALFTGSVQVCLAYDPSSVGGLVPHLFEASEAGWRDVTTSAGCGTTTTLGTFALFVDATPPLVAATVVGTVGSGDWYTSDVTVSWTVSDPQTAISSPACIAVTVVSDTAGRTFTCTAVSDGGSTAKSVTVRRDATPPTITCTPTPSTLWPPNGSLVPVNVAVAVDDATSGAEGFVLTAAPVEGASFTLGTADVSGELRAERAGNGSDRVYTLTYTAYDVAGNTKTCDATITVPHDRGHVLR